MSNIIFSILFGLYPYVCLVIFILGTCLRINSDPYSVTAKSSQFLTGKTDRIMFIVGISGFHLGIITILVGHAGGFLTPRELFLAFGISDALHAEIAHIIGGVAGIVTLLSIFILIGRRFFNSRVSFNSSFGDKAVLMLIFIQLLLGLYSIVNEGGVYNSEAKVVLFGYYFQGLLTLNFDAYKFAMNMPVTSLMHLFLGWTFFLIFPFTRLIHIITMPVQYVIRRGYQIVRSK